MSSKRKRRKNNKRVKRKLKKWVYPFIFMFVIFCGVGCYFLFGNVNIKSIPIIKDKYGYLASDNNMVKLYSLDEEKDVLVEEESVSRGKKIKILDKDIKKDEDTYKSIKLDGKSYYVSKKNVVKDEKGVVLEKNIYIRTPHVILDDIKTSKINGFATKGSSYDIVDYDYIDDNGNVHLYKVKDGYVYGKYVSYTEEEAKKHYKADVYDAIHSKVSNSYGGGEAIKLDFYPNEKKEFENNKMPESVYALYLNSGVIENVDSYIAFAKDTNINAFVVDIKDNESPAYPANTFKELSPTNYSKALNTYEEYKTAIKKLKDAGFYVIGRITTFKDTFYIQDHKENAIMNKNTNSPYLHNGSYWPSAYNRDVWYYTLSLAKESVQAFGFNEINFDYVRFPDRMNSVSNYIELGNKYNEDKIEAIQNFVTKDLYTFDIWSYLYVSIDVFGESVNGSYTTAYGQYWPGISNVCDVISGMPYPDHFAAYSYGIAKPWNNPFLLMKYWSSYAMERQKEIETPARVRTWIQAYDVMKYVDSNGIIYNAYNVEQEIRGLYESGTRGGYITWLANSSIEKYKSQKKAFQIDYLKEYNT